jgi:hypothetical protein
MKGGALKRVALLEYLMLQVGSVVAPKALNLLDLEAVAVEAKQAKVM